ncbi:MAG: glycosyltransferase [Nitrosospira multiformis]|nr:glycosyltransferase [Nitrosospira multiformis]
MRVLITNNTLDARAGSELYVRDLALALLRRGHNPVAYSTRLGAVAEELRSATIPVIDDLDLLTVAPDIIHGQHHLDAMTAMLHFPDTTAVYFCHGWLPWEEMAPRFPTIQRYVAVDDLCQERLQCLHGIPPERICVIRNFVDLRRFGVRADLPAIPRKALVFSNYINEHGCLGILREACAARGIELDVIGLSVGRSEDRPEQILGRYDIVFAKARCALEALASGTAVIACDAAGLAGMVTPDNYETFRALNFGIRSLRNPITLDTIMRELDRYEAAGAREVTRRVRSEAGLDPAIEQILHVYREAIEAHRESRGREPRRESRSDPRLQSASRYLREIADFTKRRHQVEQEKHLALAKAAAEHIRAEQAEFELAKIHNSRLWSLVMSLYRLKYRLWNRPIAALRARRENRNRENQKNQDEGKAKENNNPNDQANVFEQIHARNAWQSSESRSGPGSTLERTEILRRELPAMLSRLGIRTLVDAPCGDCNWRQHTAIDLDAYIGIDIVPALIEENRRRFPHPKWRFMVANLVEDDLPRGDAVLCRDALIHLSLADILRTLSNIRRSGTKYLLATSHDTVSVNTDITTGGWRSVNLMLAPFNLPTPLDRIIENPQTGKILGIWMLAEVPLS